MMDNNKLRRADIFSGALILMLGLSIISGAMKMPMKDSWGGVQNVWFVSPALFPLFVGGMLALLGVLLIIIAFKSVGSKGFQSVFSFLTSAECISFLKEPLTVRFYGAVLNLILFVFLLVPRVDFFPAAILFLLIFFFMFYIGDHSHLLKMLKFSIAITALFVLFVLFGLNDKLSSITEFGSDWLVLLFIAALCFLVRTTVKGHPGLERQYRISLIIAVAAPLTIGIIFKYFLLVPMPYEGLIVQLLDSIWYAEIWA
jgi:hypothetical protein